MNVVRLFFSKQRASCSWLFLLLCALAWSSVGYAQEQGDVVRVNTDLVQTTVTVLDREGKFVDGLQRDQFELLIDGQPRAVSFFEKVTDGNISPNETSKSGSSKPASHPRSIVFFVDDLHLSLDSLERTRRMLLKFVDNEKAARDQVAIASASGQIGFLQQFTNSNEVLRAAVGRLAKLPNTANGYGIMREPMTELAALIIDTRSDPKVTEYYIEDCMKQTAVPKQSQSAARAWRITCETQVKNNARAILTQAAAVTSNTYRSLASLMDSSARRPGRKLAFFVSDGFLLDTALTGGLREKLEHIIDSAQRAGVVVYTIDAKGLVSGALDATNSVPTDPYGRLAGLQTREIVASQDALNALAVDTGGRALRNQNVFDRFVEQVVNETANYYLLGWRPDTDEQKNQKFRSVKVTVIGRPELSVRLPKGYMQSTAASLAKSPSQPDLTKPPARILGDALTDYYPTSGVPTLLSVSYLNTPANGIVLTSSTQIASGALGFGQDGKKAASVDLAGVILNDKGKIVTSFKNRLSINPTAQTDESNVIYNYRAPLTPGIYQVRVAVRDEFSARVGSAMDWLVIPDIASRQLALSSLLIGGKIVETKNQAADPQVQFSVDRRFSRKDHLNFWFFVYNATHSNLTTEVQVLRDGQLVTPKERPVISKATDPALIPYVGELALTTLPAGYYELRVIVSDLVAKTTASQSVGFEVQ